MRIQDIQIKPGRRAIDTDAVQTMVNSMMEVGQLQPIVVSKDMFLIAGLHRLEAAKIMGWDKIKCDISDLDDAQTELAEIDENFVRNDLTVVQRGQMLERRKALYEKLHPEAKKGGDRKSEKIKVQKLHFDPAQAFIDNAAEKYGMSRRSVALQLQIARNLSPEAQEILKNVRISQLTAQKLSRLEPEKQIAIAKSLADGEIQSVEEYRMHDGLAEDKIEEMRQAAAPSDSETFDPATATSASGENQKTKRQRNSKDIGQDICEKTSAESKETPAADLPRSTEQIIADIKRTDKAGGCTTDEFIGSISRFAAKFHQEIEWYNGSYYDEAYRNLAEDQLDFLRSKMDSIGARAMDLFQYVERMAKNEL